MGPKWKRGRPGWPSTQVEYLRSHAGIVPAKEIAFDIGRSHISIQEKAKDLGLSLRVCRKGNIDYAALRKTIPA